ncbi:MAG: methyltransferase domain-containing protein [Candidatus Doudnabacteria bacterium]|nr:methyltransferase domain-containing protein [Candidatus Doudnabacteria bacterium]
MLPPTKVLLKGLATFIPGAYALFSKGTGGTGSARYCYSVWLRHLVLAKKSGRLNRFPSVIAELGPGDSLGIGLAALLSGADKYYGLDVVRHTDTRTNLKIFEQLIELFKRQAPIPDSREFPNIYPLLDNYEFPSDILTVELLQKTLAAERLWQLRKDIEASSEKFIAYFVPWDDAKVIKPNSVDFIYSQFVLEHVNSLELTYGSLNRWLKPGGLMSHMVDFRCHGTATKWNGQWAYSDFMWKLIKGGRPFLLNRQPASAHIQLLEKFGFNIINSLKFTSNDGIARANLSAAFKNLADDDLKTWGLFVQATK